ncbi:hypothetical protein [Acinetobacter sp. YH01005]|uniref:hypothetical protein n=1 Tax=Acinetobacter sp. YH01005 TaxID=2601021 RepID=UPI0015D28587|nr:hypothetical protein [Acinetobacter sp. YH01005]
MEILHFDEDSLKATARVWIDNGIALNLDDELIELNEQFFEHIQASKAYGDYLNRESLTTYIGIRENECSTPSIIASVGYHRRGREVTVKIFDIYISPELDSLLDSAYDSKYAEYLIFLVQNFLQHSNVPGSATKIYARTDYSQQFLQLMHDAAEGIKTELEKSGLAVEFEGKRWLAFRRKQMSA